jgi:hypothetical protein
MSTRGVEAPSEEMQARVSKLLRRIGTVRATKMLGVSREAVARIAAGLELRPGTLSLVRERLALLGTTGDDGAENS